MNKDCTNLEHEGGDARFTSTPKQTLSTSNNTDSTTTSLLPQNINYEDESEAPVPTINVEEIASQNVFMISDDPREWMINDFTRDHVATYGCKQNKNLNFSDTKRDYNDGTSRWLSESLFVRKLINGEKVPRPWLVYSVSKASVFCAACLLFGMEWNGNMRVNEHKNSKNHKKCMLTLKQRSNTKNIIEHDLVIQIETEISYWEMF
nr:zinc finger MYM-type protein 5-like [Bactrocera oleae]